MPYSIMLDAGHGGTDPGAVYNGRQEKDDNLRLTLAVGQILQNRGVDVLYTRTTDIYESPYEKAMEGNEAGVDYFVSIHRNSFPTDNAVSGIESLVYDDSGIKYEMAKNINDQLVQVGYKDLGVIERPNLVVLRRTNMPAVLVEAGFINSDADNEMFDEKFQETAQAIADGITMTVGLVETTRQEDGRPVLLFATPGNPDMNQSNSDQTVPRPLPQPIKPEMPVQPIQPINPETPVHPIQPINPQRPQRPIQPLPPLRPRPPIQPLPPLRPQPPIQPLPPQPERHYRVQIGAFRNPAYADRLLSEITDLGYEAVIDDTGDLARVMVGNFTNLQDAVDLEHSLKRAGYQTLIVG